MLTYQDVVTVRLNPLTAAAGSWDEMAASFDQLEGAYRSNVRNVARGSEWVGISADAADDQFEATRKQFEAGAVQARAVAAILRDIHGQLTERVQAVKRLVESAKEADIHIDGSGKARLDTARREARGDGVLDASRRAALEASWTAAVAGAVQAVADADEGARLALRDAAGIKSGLAGVADTALGGGGFNAAAVGDIELVEARHAQRYADLILAGGQPSDPEEWARLMRDNAHDPGFSRTVLNHIGPEGTIRLTNQLNTLAYDTATGDRQHHLSAQRGLADALATATRDPKAPFTRDFTDGLKEAGRKRHPVDGDGAGAGDHIRGYQSLVTLMRHGEGYSDRFLHELGDDMIAAERADRGADIWDLPRGFVEPRDDWFANDPVDGLLEIMSRDPAAAAAFLDPASDPNPDNGTKEGNGRLEYLLRERDWAVVDSHQFMPGPDGPWGDPRDSLRFTDIEDADTRSGLGAALVAGTTGIDPNNSSGGYVAHTETNDRVFRAAMEQLTAEGNDFPPSLRTPMAVVLGNHGDDVHAAASAHYSGDGVLDRGQLLEVSKQISRDPFAYGTLQDGINREIVHDINKGAEGDDEPLLRAGRTVGFFEEARYQGVNIDAGDAKTKAAWEAKWDYHTWGGVVNFVPHVGDAAQRGIDVLTAKWLEEETARIDGDRARENLTTGEDREGRLVRIAKHWRDENPMVKESEDEWRSIERIDDAANNGNAAARRLGGQGS
ncbi:hypothetical protein AB0G74_29750 [Streptomyces sp. NPDC020875]|uniref:hypothetical protein n=1 Tax=Streptomyces sp. NPDC020875 TaxID=3154898 RepID=UPI003408B560